MKSFALTRSALVHLTVWQQSPHCRLFGHYTVRAARGVNVLRLPRRVGSHRVTPGTYRLVGRAAQRQVLDVRVRLVRKHGKLHVRHTQLASVCLPTVDTAGVLAGLGLLGAGSGGAGGSQLEGQHASGRSNAAAPFTPPIPHHSPTLRIGSQTVSVRTLLFVLVGMAIALLAAGSVPGSAAGATPAAAVARHRAALTAAGLALIVAAVLAALLT